ncbi:MAG: LemA family protein [Campylobacter sp.]|nr:LemA family protein [Campylobacter sp.]
MEELENKNSQNGGGVEYDRNYENSPKSEKKGGFGWLKVVGILVAIAVIFGFIAVPTYNKLVKMDEDVNAAWAQVQNQYKRRADLIPNFVETVKGYASHERETLEGVINARAKATSVNVDANTAPQTMEALQQFNEAQTGLNSALSRLMLVVERYPELKANENFTQLQTQLEGTENRIAVARKDYIGVVQEYNKVIRVFPTNIIAKLVSMGGSKPVFAASEAEQAAPQVSFK